ncbi:hypothetical protein DFJ77DRAFT_438219 [Powellomyces hirtus]|nr:hypothetical protein DFJ77DRAFT_438219 [Powellomyces hirtus]
MRNRGGAAAEDARMVLASANAVTENKTASASWRLTKKASVISSASNPGSPAVATPTLNQPTTLGILEHFPTPLLLKVVNACAPELHVVRNLSHGYRDLVQKYIQKRTKRFQESIEEAECWGHRAPTLSDIVHLDPLALGNILEMHYGSKLARASGGGATMVSPSDAGAISELGQEDDDAVSRTDGGESRAPNRAAPVRALKREAMQKIIYSAFRTALDYYEDGCWATVGVLRDFVIKYGLQHSGGGTGGGNAGGVDASNTEWSSGAVVPDDQSERDVSDGASLRSLRMERTNNMTRGEYSSLQLQQQLAKDTTWLKLNSELHRQAAMHGHAFNLPALCDVEDPPATLMQGADLSVRAHRPETLVACLDASRIYGCLWSTIDKGFQAALAADRWGQRVPIDVLLVLLDAAFNDPLGPWACCTKMRGWGYEGADGSNGGNDNKLATAARNLLIRAEECAKLYGVAWHRLSIKGEFAVVPVEEVAREVRSRLKIMM